MKKDGGTERRPNVLMVGPFPPPFGGVATVVKSLSQQEALLGKFNLSIYRIGRKSSKTSQVAQAVGDLVQFLKFPLRKEARSSDIVHIHTASYWSLVRSIPYVIASKYFLRSRVVLHVHGAQFHLFYKDSGTLMRYATRKTLGMSDAIVVTSPSWIDVLNGIMADPNIPIYALPNGFAADIFFPRSVRECREKLNLPLDEKILVTIGHLEEYKGHKYLIDAMRILASKTENVTAHIIGDGSLRPDLSRQIRECNVEGRVVLEGGNKPNEEIPLWMNACDVFVLPSLNEGNPTVMFEALGCNKPFVGTKVGGIPDVINSEKYGLLVEPADPKQLAEKIEIALERQWNAEEIGAYAAQFSWANISNRIASIYEAVLRGS